MPLPKRKTSRANRDMRRTHKKLKATNFTPCPQCHEMKLPHHVCPNCGHYNGKEEVKTEV